MAIIDRYGGAADDDDGVSKCFLYSLLFSGKMAEEAKKKVDG